MLKSAGLFVFGWADIPRGVDEVNRDCLIPLVVLSGYTESHFGYL